MSNEEKTRAVRFKVADSLPTSTGSTEVDQHVGTGHLPSRTPNTIAQSDSSSSLWNLPGIDKDNFYAAALYLHAVADGLEGRLWPRGSKTRPRTRDFLDSLADCFARSKARDAPDHVSATAMVRSSQRKQITLYIAKNRSSKPSDDAKDDQGAADRRSADENKVFAQELIGWFNELAETRGQANESYEVDPDDHVPAGDETEGDQSEGDQPKSYDPSGDDSKSDEIDHYDKFQDLPPIFSTICGFNQSRLRYYVEKISDVDRFRDSIEGKISLYAEKDIVGWRATETVLNACKRYREGSSTPVELAKCAFLAGKTRKAQAFHQLTERVKTSNPDSPLRYFGLLDSIEGVNYLGRLYAALLRFHNFCRHSQQRNWSFRYVLLVSRQDTWNGESYLNQLRSWKGDLELNEVHQVKSIVNGKSVFLGKTVQQRMEDIVNTARDTAPVHCEMQLMMHFLSLEAPKCFDYFGCSKKSCWLCWHMMVQNQKFSMKDTHRKLYPRWAFPFEFSQQQLNVAEGLRIAHNNMITLVQDKIIKRKNIGSLGPFLQSSARLTPANQKNAPSSFVGDYIKIEHMIELFNLPALHVPERAQEKQVKVAFYHSKESEGSMHINYTKFNGHVVVPAFQMETKPGTAEQISELNQFQACRWWVEVFRDHTCRPLDPTRWFVLYYRSADSPMEPNWFVKKAWMPSYGEPEISHFPWRGDIFIFHGEIDDELLLPNYLDAAHDIDIENCLQSLVKHFEGRGADYSGTIRNQNREASKSYLKTTISLLKALEG